MILITFTKINLVGDILRLFSELINAAEQAINLIKWLLNHLRLLALFYKEQLQITETTCMLNLPAITQWASHFLSFTSLISKSLPLCSLVMLHPGEFLSSAGRSPEQVQQVRTIMQSIEDADFWQKLTEPPSLPYPKVSCRLPPSHVP